jgi:hypothetical protein
VLGLNPPQRRHEHLAQGVVAPVELERGNDGAMQAHRVRLRGPADDPVDQGRPPEVRVDGHLGWMIPRVG